jgi:hypothetical protein
LFGDATEAQASFCPTGRQSRPYLVRARLAERKASLLIPSLTPPNPHADAKGASLFVPDLSRAFLIRPRTMHDETRTGPPHGHALLIPHCREAQTRITLSFRDQKAAIRPGRRIQQPVTSSRCRNWLPLVQFRRRMDGPHGGIKDRFPRLGKTIA